jgi:hypothetical protein
VVRLTDFPERETWDLAVGRAVAAFTGPDNFGRFPAYPRERSKTRFADRTINTHPALLPGRFPGQQGVRTPGLRVKITFHRVLIDAGTSLRSGVANVRSRSGRGRRDHLQRRIKVWNGNAGQVFAA